MINNKISVVIPTHERSSGEMEEFFLNRCIRSVLNQTVSADIEIIVVIDGVSRKIENIVGKIVAANEINNINLLSTEKKVGGSGARNFGIKASTGKWIALLDDDDEWLPQKLEKQLELMKKRGRENAFCFSSVFINNNIFPRKKWTNNLNLSEYLFCSKYGKIQGFIQTSTIFAPKSLFDTSAFTENLPQLQDWDWELKTRGNLNIDIIFIEEPLSYFHSDGIANTRVSKQVNLDFFETWLEEREHYFSAKAKASFIMNIIVPAILRTGLTKKEKFIEGFKKFIKAQLKISFTLENFISYIKFVIRLFTMK